MYFCLVLDVTVTMSGMKKVRPPTNTPHVKKESEVVVEDSFINPKRMYLTYKNFIILRHHVNVVIDVINTHVI